MFYIHFGKPNGFPHVKKQPPPPKAWIGWDELDANDFPMITKHAFFSICFYALETSSITRSVSVNTSKAIEKDSS